MSKKMKFKINKTNINKIKSKKAGIEIDKMIWLILGIALLLVIAIGVIGIALGGSVKQLVDCMKNVFSGQKEKCSFYPKDADIVNNANANNANTNNNGNANNQNPPTDNGNAITSNGLPLPQTINMGSGTLTPSKISCGENDLIIDNAVFKDSKVSFRAYLSSPEDGCQATCDKIAGALCPGRAFVALISCSEITPTSFKITKCTS